MSTKKDYFKDNGDGTMTITLSRGFKVNGAVVTEITMREPTVGDQIVASESKASEAQKDLAMFSNLCEIAPDDLRNLPLRDYTRLAAAFANFID
jgi:hypothetical protein